MTDARVKLSVVIPMLNEMANCEELFTRLFPVLDACGETFEVIVIDDGSTDETLRRVKAWSDRRPELTVLSFVRNFGQHAAVMAGFRASSGDWVITMDADLQNPPEEIPALIHVFRKGHDLINTHRSRRRDSFLRRLASRLTGAMIRRFSGIDLQDFGCMLRGYHRNVVQRILQREEFKTFIPALAMWYARCPVEISVSHAARERGTSKYSLLRLFSLQLDLMIGFSIAPLRLLFRAGWMIAFLGAAFGTLLMVLRFVKGAGWAAEGVFTVLAVLFFFIGAQFLAFGVLGEYIGRIYQEVRQRPSYVLRGPHEPMSEEDTLPVSERVS